ncbi:MAG: phosphatidylinositol mannoside acyltransferase [Acidimicrobiales bacterium]
MALDLVTPAYRAGASFSQTVPRPVAELAAMGLSRLTASLSKERRMLVARHLCRADPTLEGKRLDRAVDATFRSYARYWIDSFRLPQLSTEQVDFGFGIENFAHFADALAKGKGAIGVMPHLGGWEWAGFWLTRVMKVPVTVVVEPVEPPALFSFFADFRRSLGMNIVPLGPDAGREVLQALAANHIICLLADRDIGGDGIEMEFFGETTSLPAGPATLALRTGAALIPCAVYFEGKNGHRAVVQDPINVEREGRFREDVYRITSELALRLETLICHSPTQWHLQQPNWPSDYEELERIGKPHQRPLRGPSSLAATDKA